MSSARSTGQNVMLAATLALLSYIPFELVAKSSMIMSVVLFVLDPIPGTTRFLALLLVGGVDLLSKAHRRSLMMQRDGSKYVDMVAEGDFANDTLHDSIKRD